MAQPQSALRQMPTQSAEPFVRSYNPFNPAFRDTVRSGINELIGGREMGGTPTQRYRAGMADLLTGAVDFVPGIGDAVGVADTVQAARGGNYGTAAMLGGATMLGMLPIVGDAASKAVRGALRDAPTISAGSRTSLDPNSLFFRESEQNRLEQASDLFDSGEEIQPIVTIYNNGRRDILDGHNRASIAISRNQNLPAVDIDIAEYDLLKGAGFDDMEIAYATLLRADEDEAASAINNQFYGSGIRQRGAEALSRMDSPAPASAAPSPLEGTLDMSQAARMQTEYELAHEVAQRNAALPVEQGGLGLPPNNTAMDRAKAMGFDTPAYHGTNNDIAEFDTGRSGAKTGNPNARLGIFTTPNTQEASRYAEAWGKEGGNVMPLMIRSGSTYQMPYTELDDLAMAPYRAMMADPNYNPDSVVYFGDMAGQKAAAERLRGYDQAGIDAVALYREKLLADGYDTAVVLKGKPREEIITFDPANIRSRFAAFDPAKRGSANLLAGAAGATIGLSALRNIQRDEERQPD